MADHSPFADHSPLPWHVGPYYRFDIEARDGRVGGGSPSFTPRGDANAEFIVRAVNSHDALVAALKAARAWMDDRRELAEIVQAILDADVALLKAEDR